MSDPERWADAAGDATAFERELFRSGQAAALPADEKRRQWLAIAEQAALLPAASIPAAPHALAGKAVAKGLAGAGWLKALTLLPVLAGAGAYALTHSAPNHAASPAATHAAPRAPVAAPDRGEPMDSPARVAPAAKGTATVARVRERAPASPPTEPAVAAIASAAAAEQNSEVRTTSHLAEEARAVLAARNALRSSDPSSALRTLDDARARFSDGSLGQEREALTIEALSRAGRKQAASARARAFLARFPNSPLASNVRRFE